MRARSQLGALVLIAAAGVLAALGASGRPASAQDAPRDVTYRAPLASGGDVLITFTPNLSGVTRAEVRQGLFEWVVPTSFETLSLHFSHHLYFDPPVAMADGQFELSIPDQLMGMSRDSVRIDGTVKGGEISGTATLIACVYPGSCIDLSSVDWSGASVINTPPWPNDTIRVGHIEGQSGTLQLSLNRDGNLTSLTLDNVVAASCFDPPLTLNVHAFFDPPINPSEGIRELVLGSDLRPLSTTVTIDGETISGTLVVPDSVFAPNCTLRLPWTAGPPAETPAATATPQASGSLPATGGGGDADGWGLLAAAIALAGCGATLALLGALARRPR